MSVTQNLNSNQKKFFRVQATRLVALLETLTGSVALTGPEKFLRKATYVSVFFLRYPQKQPDDKVLISYTNACTSVAVTNATSLFF